MLDLFSGIPAFAASAQRKWSHCVPQRGARCHSNRYTAMVHAARAGRWNCLVTVRFIKVLRQHAVAANAAAKCTAAERGEEHAAVMNARGMLLSFVAALIRTGADAPSCTGAASGWFMLDPCPCTRHTRACPRCTWGSAPRGTARPRRCRSETPPCRPERISRPS